MINYSGRSILALDSLIFIPFGIYALIRLRANREEPARGKHLCTALAFLSLIPFVSFDLLAVEREILFSSSMPFRLSFVSFSVFITWSLYLLMKDKVRRVLPVYTNEDYTRALRKTGLSDREIEIVEQVAEGNPNREIAETLFISENTVKTHIKNIYKKLSISSRIQLHKVLEKIRLTQPGD
ncbi:MAG: LuxR family transcriptional regulator [Spirochaetales bacterium]|nr:MAG: LuxR family transcriptional regulator [Spirochaetales bacterium]